MHSGGGGNAITTQQAQQALGPSNFGQNALSGLSGGSTAQNASATNPGTYGLSVPVNGLSNGSNASPSLQQILQMLQQQQSGAGAAGNASSLTGYTGRGLLGDIGQAMTLGSGG